MPTVTLSNVPLPPSVWIMRRITASDSFEPNVAKVLPSKSFGDLIALFEASEHQMALGFCCTCITCLIFAPLVVYMPTLVRFDSAKSAWPLFAACSAPACATATMSTSRPTCLKYPLFFAT